MAKNKSRSFARHRKHARVRKKIQGTPDIPRLNVFRSLVEIYAQLIDDESGHTIVSASSLDHDLRTQMKGLKKTSKPTLWASHWLSVQGMKEFARLCLTVVAIDTLVASKRWLMEPVRAVWSFSRG